MYHPSWISSGRVPSSITYVFSKTKWLISVDWDDSVERHCEQVYAAFPLDAASKDRLVTARRWASKQVKNAPYGATDKVKNQLKKEVLANKPDDVIEITVPNDPVEGLMLNNLEIRQEGGRAYKVLVSIRDPETGELYDLYVDLREDTMMDILMNSTVSSGVLDGKYVWAVIGSETKLIRVGSAVHKLIVAHEAKMAQESLGKKALQVGHLYEDKQGSKFLFVGVFNTLTVSPNRDEQVEGESKYNSFVKVPQTFRFTQSARQPLFVAWIEHEGEKNVEFDTAKNMTTSGAFAKWIVNNSWNVSFGSKAMVKYIGPAPVAVPEGLAEAIRSKAVEIFLEKVGEVAKHSKGLTHWYGGRRCGGHSIFAMQQEYVMESGIIKFMHIQEIGEPGNAVSVHPLIQALFQFDETGKSKALPPRKDDYYKVEPYAPGMKELVEVFKAALEQFKETDPHAAFLAGEKKLP